MRARPRLEVADVVRSHGHEYVAKYPATAEQQRVLLDIERCRTAALGGHIETCDQCGEYRNAYNSCRNRHCPKCQSLAKARWLEARLAELLPVEYFHVVFTLPNQIAPLALANRRLVYGLLFAAAAETLRTLASDPRHLGAEIGFIAVLHTWGQNLRLHPHLHCVVPGGGLHPNGQQWVACRPGFLFPVRVLSRLFRRLMLERLEAAYRAGDLRVPRSLSQLDDRRCFQAWLNKLEEIEWVVYAKRPFAGPEQVLDYLGRYTHRVAISNHRLVNLEDGRVSFRWRDYRHGRRQRTMTLNAVEFLRCFLLHTLPSGFVRIRHFGWLANRHRAKKLQLARRLLGVESAPTSSEIETAPGWEDLVEKLSGRDPTLCPNCHRGRLVVTQTLAIPRETPAILDSS